MAPIPDKAPFAHLADMAVGAAYGTPFQAPSGVTAGPGGTVASRIWQSTLTAAAATISITGIPTGWRHLQLIYSAASSVVGANDDVKLQFNNDTGNNYDSQRLQASATAATGIEALATAYTYGGALPGTTAPANQFSGTIITIFNYTSAYLKSTSGSYMVRIGTASGQFYTGTMSGNWRSTVAINRIDLTPVTSSNFIAGSTFELKGIS